MTKKNANKQQTKGARRTDESKAQKKNKNRGGKRGTGVPRGPAIDFRTMALADLIRDPCHAKIDNIPGATGETIIRRIRTLITVHNSPTFNSGYMVWYPEYHGSANTSVSGDNCNLFHYETTAANIGVRPTNTALLPLGTSLSYAAQGRFSPDPVAVIVSADTTAYSSACTLSACMNMLYSGTTSNNSGFVYPVEDLPATTFFNVNSGGVGTVNGASSILSLTTFAKSRLRVPMEGVEVIVRPKRYAFRGPGSDASTGVASNTADGLFGIGFAGTIQTILYCADPNQTSGFGLAWTGLNVTVGADVTIECIKVVELTIRPTEGIVEAVPGVPPGPTKIEEACQFLDDNTPGWQTRVSNGASHLASGVANMALAGAVNYMRRRSDRRLM